MNWRLEVDTDIFSYISSLARTSEAAILVAELIVTAVTADPSFVRTVSISCYFETCSSEK